MDAKSQISGMLQQLAGALRSTELYPQGHPAVHTPLRHVASTLAALLTERERVTLGLVDDVLVLDEIPFYDAPTRFKAVYATLTDRKLEAVHFLRGVSLGELERLLVVLSPRGPHAGESVPEAAKRHSIEHVSFAEKLDDDSDPRARAHATYHASLGIVVDLMSELRLGRIPSSERAVQIIDDMRDIILTDESALLGLTLLKNYDEYTYVHSVNVAIFCLAFGKKLGLTGEALRRVGLGGLLHDVGKVRTCEQIIRKPGALTDDEMRIMQRHPELGAEITAAMRGVDRETGEIVLHHHIRHDGTGYPELPAGSTVHPHGQIVALADCYDALTTTRTYQKSRHPSEAVRLVRRMAGKAYAPEIVTAFAEMMGTYPVGELVRLASNELAVVTTLNHVDATSPKVRIVTDREGRSLDSPADVDLAAESGSARLIVASVDPLVKGIDVGKILAAA
ncbi:MAG: HD-GYP domain-containing protein [Deltaproteobacteria bacterium]|nr:HD-GYP domain-containing protein [Deltaproteobacteria bacterium]